MRAVRLGGPLTLVVVGLILALAITNDIQGVDIHMIGWIIAGAGVVWFTLDYWLNRSQHVVEEEHRGRDTEGHEVIRKVTREGPS